MRIFGISKSKKLQKRVDSFPEAPAFGLNAESIMIYLDKALALLKEVDEAMQKGVISKELGEKLKNSIRKKGLANHALRSIIEKKLYKE